MRGGILAHLPAVRCKDQEWTGSHCSRAFSRCGLWSVAPLHIWTPASCRWSPPWLCQGLKGSLLLLFPWKRNTQVHIEHILHIMYILHIDVFVYRYILRTSQPVYGVWYYFMLHRGISTSLQRVLPKYIPRTEADVDELLGCKVFRYKFFIFSIFFIFFIFWCHVFSLKIDGMTTWEVPLIGAGFHAFIDHLFWYLPFASVKQGNSLVEEPMNECNRVIWSDSFHNMQINIQKICRI